MKKGRRANFLDYIPLPDPRNGWSGGAGGAVTVHLAHRGVYARLAQKLFHTPPVSHITLDEYGSFLWRAMDGQRTVGQLALALGARYGGAAEPLYPRLVSYLRTLYDNRFIVYRRPGGR